MICSAFGGVGLFALCLLFSDVFSKFDWKGRNLLFAVALNFAALKFREMGLEYNLGIYGGLMVLAIGAEVLSFMRFNQFRLR